MDFSHFLLKIIRKTNWKLHDWMHNSAFKWTDVHADVYPLWKSDTGEPLNRERVPEGGSDREYPDYPTKW